MTELKSLKRSRVGHKSYAVRIIKESEDLVKSKVSGEEFYELETQLITNQKILEDKLSVIKDLDERISASIENDEEFGTEMIESNEFQRVILQTSVAISNWLKRNSSDSVSTMSAAEPVSSSLKNSSNSVSAKLPKLTLQKFSGDPLCFRSFWDSFESAIDKNSSLDEISKFNYLRGLLEGKASLALQGLVLTSENYVAAKGLLNERFGDDQIIIAAHMDALLNIAPIGNNNVTELRNIYDLIEVHTRNLQILDVDARHYGPVLVPVVMNKLPSQFRLEITRKMPPENGR